MHVVSFASGCIYYKEGEEGRRKRNLVAMRGRKMPLRKRKEGFVNGLIKGDHFVNDLNVESLCSTPETNMK